MPITSATATVADSALRQPFPLLDALEPLAGEYQTVQFDPAIRIYLCTSAFNPPAVLLPLDRLFDVRCTAALQLWRLLNGKTPGIGPKPLTEQHRDRLVLALRALDAHQRQSSYRQIAKGLFQAGTMTARNWETHDLRDRTIRLVRLGTDLMKGGYRRLLLYPYRARF